VPAAGSTVIGAESTEQHGVADEARSVIRQIDHPRAYAAAKDWTVNDEHVFADDGISGAEFTTRPGCCDS
jgi:hypothetical protein